MAFPDLPCPPADLFFSMAGLTSSVASALSELSLSDVDLGSSMHSDVASRRLSAHAHPAGECSQGKGSRRRPQCPSDVICPQEAPADASGPPWVTWFPGAARGMGEAGTTVDRGQVSKSVIWGQALKFLETQFPFL